MVIYKKMFSTLCHILKLNGLKNKMKNKLS